ncbi:MBL fold metallo-hydrolase [Nocardioides sp. GY 10127]|uniref:MBL fold metallo-hydrolase n=1 Tax=Nocardioides sp. GY 10127 TaxID=2569762 RepID=UPI0010A83163|nr:MBL fold metallo-hydrolase [Nocardioides sp. GY 10127]TIC83987.1 MBL fold metallo-hydrolase [Nocardioides sp. GY 10127]
MTPATAAAPFTEVADRVWVSRRAWWDVNVTVVAGERGLVVIDTHASVAAGRALVDDVRDLARATGTGDVVAVVATHAHFDHVLGTPALRDAWGADLPVHAHEGCVEELRAWASDPGPAPEAASPQGWTTTQADVDALVLPDHAFSAAGFVDLGDRLVELLHPGRGHTGGDLVAVVADADVVVAGDLVEESGPPALGADSHPLEWPLTLDVVLPLLGRGTVVVPGHGLPVGRDFVEEQRAQLGILAETVRDLAGRGVSVEDAVRHEGWAGSELPWAPEDLGDAIRRIYEQLPRSQKRLPLL